MFHVKQFTNQQNELLGKYVDLLLKWNLRINLIGRSTETEVWERHILDSAQVMSLITNKNLNICDLGSGAGLPGVVLRILGCNKVTLVEADQKKCVFLREVRRLLGLEIDILDMRIEDIKGKQFDLIVSRAMASVEKILELSERLLMNGSRVILFKGEKYRDELSVAEAHWSFKYKIYPSQTSSEGVLLEFNQIMRKQI